MAKKSDAQMKTKSKTIGIVLSGGGARGAYQVGVLSAIAEICHDLRLENPFKIYTGVSAGAINAAFLASGAGDFIQTTKRLVDLWSQIDSDQVFYTDAINLGKTGFKWLEEISWGALSGTPPGRSLLDTAPLRQLLVKSLDFENIKTNLESGKLRGVAVTAMDYGSSNGVTFVQGNEEIKMWSKARRRAEKAKLTTDHIMASSAIPLLFPPIAIKDSYFGDGCIRNQSPCGPAIYMGAEKLIVIGVRMQLSNDAHVLRPAPTKAPSVARVINVLLNAVMLDGIEIDIERLEYVNKLASQLEALNLGVQTTKSIEYAWVSPTVDIGEIAREKSSHLPRIIRYMLKGLGSLEDAREIVSYLLFDPSFCTQLIEIGFEDGMRQKEQIKKILLED